MLARRGARSGNGSRRNSEEVTWVVPLPLPLQMLFTATRTASAWSSSLHRNGDDQVLLTFHSTHSNNKRVCRSSGASRGPRGMLFSSNSSNSRTLRNHHQRHLQAQRVMRTTLASRRGDPGTTTRATGRHRCICRLRGSKCHMASTLRRHTFHETPQCLMIFLRQVVNTQPRSSSRAGQSMVSLPLALGCLVLTAVEFMGTTLPTIAVIVIGDPAQEWTAHTQQLSVVDSLRI